MSRNYANYVYLTNTCFSNNQDITSVNLHNIPWINNSMFSAFNNCQNLQSVNNINENVINMSEAFKFCQNITSVPNIPDNVKNMERIFYSCENLSSFPDIPNGVNNIKYAYGLCTNLRNPPTIPNGITDLLGTFYDCRNLSTAPVIPNSVTQMQSTFHIDPIVFSNDMTPLTEPPIIPNSVTTLYDTFSGQTHLLNVPSIPNSVTDLRQTFTYCYNLTSINLTGNYVTNSKYTFSGCNNLTDINISLPNTTDITNIFNGCSNLTNAHVEFNKIDNISNLFNNCVSLKSVNISAQNATDARCLFYYCNNLTDVNWNIPNATNLYQTFYNCQNLLNAPTLPPNVESLDYTFEDCKKLENPPAIPNSVISMARTFGYCNSLTHTPEIPNSVTNMWMTYYYCHNLSTVGNIPNSVVDIDWCFQGCYLINSVPNIPESVRYMRGTFGLCNNLTGNIFIHSNQIQNVYSCFQMTEITKNVYIPFEYENGVHTETYNAFIAEGYDTLGTKCGVYLKDIDGSKLTINATPADATVLMFNETLGGEVDEDALNKFSYTNTNNDILINGLNTSDTNIIVPTLWSETNGMRATDGSIINYKVFKEGYNEVSNSIIVNDSEIINVNLEQTMCTYTINPIPVDATDTINGETRNSITVPYGTEISYSVSKNHYGTITGSEVVKTSTQKFIQLPIDQHTFTINPTPDDAGVQILIENKLRNQQAIDWIIASDNYNRDILLQEYIGSSTDVIMPTTFTTNNTITADYGSVIEWKVSKEGYADKTGTLTLEGDTEINVELIEITYGVDVSDYNYTLNNEIVTLTEYIGEGGYIDTPELEEI